MNVTPKIGDLNQYFTVAALLVLLIVGGCSSSSGPSTLYKPEDSNIIHLPLEYFNGLRVGNFMHSVWTKNQIYSSMPLRRYDLDPNMHLFHDSIMQLESGLTEINGLIGLRLSPDSTKLLCVKNKDLSFGNLQEIDLTTLKTTELVSNTYEVSCGVYINDDSIIFYAYGSYSKANTYPEDAGYYLYIRSTGKIEMFLHHISPFGPNEVQNGFDIHPDHSRIIIASVSLGASPIVFEYNLKTHVQDTLPLHFKTDYTRCCLSLRYSHDGSRILYCSYPYDCQYVGGNPTDDSEIGIIDRQTFATEVLHFDSYANYPGEIDVFPEWSPDEQYIVLGTNPIANGDRLSDYYCSTVFRLNK